VPRRTLREPYLAFTGALCSLHALVVRDQDGNELAKSIRFLLTTYCHLPIDRHRDAAILITALDWSNL
jgi:hypothetical protein